MVGHQSSPGGRSNCGEICERGKEELREDAINISEELKAVECSNKCYEDLLNVMEKEWLKAKCRLSSRVRNYGQ